MGIRPRRRHERLRWRKLYTGRAAMMVHGAWTYGTMQTSGGDFVSGGHLGYMNFPPVEGGKGDPSDTVGNPGQYLAISSKATAEQKDTAKKFFTTAVLSDERFQHHSVAANENSVGDPCEL